MPLEAGSTLGPYQIISRIGAGGMGEVYKARDTRLDRNVAIKVAAAEFGERFERQARAVAALNHVNVCTCSSVTEPPYTGDSLSPKIGDVLRRKKLSTTIGASNYAYLHNMVKGAGPKA